MISFGAKRVNGKLLLRRWFRLRTSDARKRFDIEYKRLRKKWWHFKTRWETNNEAN